ncbi:hypothetical protein BH09MYX1_BH09MYX1_44660 [soil metagenome]
MTPEERDSLIEAVTTAHRTIDPYSRMTRASNAWHDLDEAGRAAAYERTLAARTLESALDPEGLSSTARAVLARLS